MTAPGTFREEVNHAGQAAILSNRMAAIISPMLYGLAHLFLAWGSRFPNPSERVLWQVSSLVIACSGLALYFASLIDKWSDESDAVSGRKSIDGFMVPKPIPRLIISYTRNLAAAILITEGFWQLHSLDSAAYQLPSWSNYWPHFS